ncbi:MAG: response regulator transcription factor [Oscillospiraceae bacterium]|nr:response regulator transcription factor [Oscillospiraceae bacterium]
MMNILVCDDEKDIVSALKIYLSGEDYRVFEAADGREALETVKNNEIHLILMDVMMPKMDGIAATAALREITNAPILMLTAKGESADKILGLNVGADDYITKPFDPAEVLARVRSHLRRYTRLGARPAEERKNVWSVGPVTLDEEAVSVTVDGEPVTLTPIEFNILRLLISHPGRVYSSAQIYEQVWNENAVGAENAVSVHIRHLRQKIEIDPSDPRYLKVVWGLGYKMEGGTER